MSVIGGKWYASSREGDDADDVRYVLADQPAGEKYIVAKVWANDDGDFASTARLVAAAPELLDGLREAVRALNTAHRFRVGDTDSYAIAALCDEAIRKAEGRIERWAKTED